MKTEQHPFFLHSFLNSAGSYGRCGAVLALSLVASLALTGCNDKAAMNDAAPVKLDTPEKKWSYALGQNFAQNIAKAPIALETNALMAGVRDAFHGKSELTPTESEKVLTELQKSVSEKQLAQHQKDQEEAEKAGASNAAAGAQFLATNKLAPGVVETASGLQYKVLSKGKGSNPKLSDTVKVHYTGRLLNGTVFDSSVERGQPATFPVGGLIPGWTEALQLMRPGDKWQLFIPASIAYGSEQNNGPIPAGSTLLFDIELIGIEGLSGADADKPAKKK